MGIAKAHKVELNYDFEPGVSFDVVSREGGESESVVAVVMDDGEGKFGLRMRTADDWDRLIEAAGEAKRRQEEYMQLLLDVEEGEILLLDADGEDSFEIARRSELRRGGLPVGELERRVAEAINYDEPEAKVPARTVVG